MHSPFQTIALCGIFGFGLTFQIGTFLWRRRDLSGTARIMAATFSWIDPSGDVIPQRLALATKLVVGFYISWLLFAFSLLF